MFWDTLLEQEGVLSKVWSMKLSKMSWYTDALRGNFTGTKGSSPVIWRGVPKPHTVQRQDYFLPFVLKSYLCVDVHI